MKQDAQGAGPAAIFIGTLGKNAWIDALVAQGRMDTKKLSGAWESYIIATVSDPAPGIATGLVIVGSDRRGTAYGVYELTEAMGVSPWASGPMSHRAKTMLTVPAGTRRFGSPSIKYLGIFINDEDWGLFVAAEGEHAVASDALDERAINADPANARLADEYGIVTGSSHAEPMLRNNVGEWEGAGRRIQLCRKSGRRPRILGGAGPHQRQV